MHLSFQMNHVEIFKQPWLESIALQYNTLFKASFNLSSVFNPTVFILRLQMKLLFYS